MRLNDDKMQQAQEARVRRIVREEIQMALGAIAGAAYSLDTPYDTPELDSRAYQAGREVVRRALYDLTKCWTEGHEFTDVWGQVTKACRRCATPNPNPFEEGTNG